MVCMSRKKKFQVAAQMTEGMCFGSAKAGREVAFSLHRQTLKPARRQRKQEGRYEYSEEQLESRH